MENYRDYYQQWIPNTEVEITCYDQMLINEIIVHKIYKEIYDPRSRYMRITHEDKNILNEAVRRYCRKHDINIDHIFAINLVGDLVPRRIEEKYLNIDAIVNSREGTLVEWEIKENIKEIRSELNKRKAETEINFEWIGEWK